MRYFRRLTAGLFWLTVCVFSLSAQTRPVATIEYASGNDVVVIRDGKKLVFPDPIGLDLFEGDQVQTGRAVLLEMRLLQNSSVIKLAENTTFLLERSSADGKTVLRLVYGRIRAKVEKLVGTQTFSVASSTAVAGVRGTDFGFEIVAPRMSLSALPLTKVYCFEGSLAVTAFEQTAIGAAERLEAMPVDYIVEAGEMVVVEKIDKKDKSNKTSIDAETKTFWQKNDFKVSDPTMPPKKTLAPPPESEPPAAVPELPAPVAVSTEPEPTLVYVPDMDFANKLRMKSRLKDSGILGALVLSVTGLGLEGYSLYVGAQGRDVEATQFRLIGAIVGASAVPFLVFSIVIQP